MLATANSFFLSLCQPSNLSNLKDIEIIEDRSRSLAGSRQRNILGWKGLQLRQLV
jgi:hypothetical protein